MLLSTPIYEEVRDQLNHDGDHVKPIRLIEDMREMLELALCEMFEDHLGIDFDPDYVDELMEIIEEDF